MDDAVLSIRGNWEEGKGMLTGLYTVRPLKNRKLCLINKRKTLKVDNMLNDLVVKVVVIGCFDYTYFISSIVLDLTIPKAGFYFLANALYIK